VKKVLFDENMPRMLRRDLPEFVVRTVQEEGWAGLKNGDLLRRAVLSFDVLLTADQRLRYQQNTSQFAIGIVVIETFDTTIANLRTLLPQVRLAIENAVDGEITIIRPI
jgi:hypothetical protein